MFLCQVCFNLGFYAVTASDRMEISMSLNREEILDIENRIGYVFTDKSLLIQAFTRASYVNEHKGHGGTPLMSNEVLEFFGDSALSCAIVSFFMRERCERYTHGIKTALTEGDFSNIRSKLSDKTNLSKSTEALGLEKYLLLGQGDVKKGVADEPSVKEDLFESIIGAIYIDSGMNIETVISAVSRMLDVSVYTEAKSGDFRSAKGALQEFCADKKRRLPPPVYRTLSESGPDHKKLYRRGCYIGERLVACGEGKSFKIADAISAEKALEILKSEKCKS